MENKELETWLEETKAKNLSKEELKKVTNNLDTVFYNKLRKELKVSGTLYEHLFNQWQKEAEFSPKRGDRVLVWDDNDDPIERIFLAKIEGAKNPIVVVNGEYKNEFQNNQLFDSSQYEHMKPLPTEQPTESDFKSQVIELIKKNINDKQQKLEFVIDKNNLIYEAVLECIVAIQKDLLEQVKQIC